jgi:NADPH-dependent curcumin reductase CurA
LPESLKKHCPGGIDIDFENVGGEALDAILSLINLRARIVLCGLISQYNATEQVPGPYNFINVLIKRARVEGFIVLDYFDRAEEAESQLGKWFKEGRIRYRVDVVEGLEDTPRSVNRLFDGSHKGKLIVRVSEEPSL